MIMMESIGSGSCCYGVKEEEGGRRRKEGESLVTWLQAKPRLLIGWRDRAGFLALTGESRISEARLRTSSPSLEKDGKKAMAISG